MALCLCIEKAQRKFMQDSLHAARVLMGDSLGFHIIFVIFSLTLPILVAWFELLGIRKKDKAYIDTAKFWSKIMTVLVVAGVLSGTVIALQMSLIWPGILKFGGEVIGLPFMMETYAFLIEATFLGLYMFTWGNPKIAPMLHWFFGVMVAVGANLSAFFITSVNAWMNLPTGFDIINGKISNIDTLAAMFSRTSIIEFTHSMPGYYLAATLVLAGGYAIKILLEKRKKAGARPAKMDQIILRNLVGFAAVMFLLSGLTAHITGQYLAKHEPTKLAALELHQSTSSNAPFIYGGVPDENGEVKGPHIRVPNLLSILAGNSPSAVVEGLEETPVDKRPPLYIHILFDIKLLLVGALGSIVFGYLALRRWKPNWSHKTIVLLAIGISGPLGIIIIELGWMLTEIGRQPWAVRGYVTTAQAVTTQDTRWLGLLFPIAYVALFTVTVMALVKLVKTHGKKEVR